MTVPWHLGPVGDDFNPALVVGSEYTWIPFDHVRFYQTANLGFLRHAWWITAVFLDTEVGITHALPYGINTDVRLGVGYAHFFWRRETLELEDGAYVDAADSGKPSLMVPLTVALGYHGRGERPLPVSPFISAQWAFQPTFLDEIPLVTHLMLLAGARISLW